MKIKVSVSTGYTGSVREKVLEIDDEDFEGMSEEEKEDSINDIAFDYMIGEMINWNWECEE